MWNFLIGIVSFKILLIRQNKNPSHFKRNHRCNLSLDRYQRRTKISDKIIILYTYKLQSGSSAFIMNRWVWQVWKEIACDSHLVKCSLLFSHVEITKRFYAFFFGEQPNQHVSLNDCLAAWQLFCSCVTCGL